MRQNIFDWLETLKNNHGININIEDDTVKKFILAYYGRNIIVHNNGKINEEYLKAVKKLKIKEMPQNKYVECTLEYLEEAIDASVGTMFVIVYNLLKKIYDMHCEEFVEEILEYGVDLISNKKYNLAREMFSILKEEKGIVSELQIYCKINYWQTFKWANRIGEVKDDIEAFDISAYNDFIKLGIYALLDEYAVFFEIIDNKLSKKEEAEKLVEALEKWPIFQDVRKEKMYEAIKKKYSDIFECKSLNQDMEQSEDIMNHNISEFTIY